MSIRVKSFLKDVGGAGRVTEARRGGGYSRRGH